MFVLFLNQNSICIIYPFARFLNTLFFGHRRRLPDWFVQCKLSKIKTILVGLRDDHKGTVNKIEKLKVDSIPEKIKVRNFYITHNNLSL